MISHDVVPSTSAYALARTNSIHLDKTAHTTQNPRSIRLLNMRFLILLASACAIFLPVIAAAAATKWQDWRVHSSKGYELSKQRDYKQSLSEYRLALGAAKEEHADAEVLIDLQLDMVQDLVAGHHFQDAQVLLNQIGNTVPSSYKDSLLEKRYWQRVHDFAYAQHNWKLAVKAQQSVVRVLGKYFALTSPACLDELHTLQTDLCAGEYWNELLPVTTLYRQELSRNPSKLAATKYRTWLNEACVFVFAAANDRSGQHTVEQRLRLMALLPQVCIQPRQQLDMWLLLTGVDDDAIRLQARRNYIALAESMSGNLNDLDKTRLIGTYLAVMFWLLDKGTYDQEGEDCARKAMERLRHEHPINVPILIQAQCMYAMILAKRGKPEQGSEVLDALQIPSDTIKKTIELGPYSNARPHIAEVFAQRGDEAGVRHQFVKLDQLVKSQRLLVVDPALLRNWHAQEEIFIQQCKSKPKHN